MNRKRKTSQHFKIQYETGDIREQILAASGFFRAQQIKLRKAAAHPCPREVRVRKNLREEVFTAVTLYHCQHMMNLKDQFRLFGQQFATTRVIRYYRDVYEV